MCTPATKQELNYNLLTVRLDQLYCKYALCKSNSCMLCPKISTLLNSSSYDLLVQPGSLGKKKQWFIIFALPLSFGHNCKRKGQSCEF